MGSVSAIVVLHEEGAPEARQLMALCPEHLALLRAIRWVALDEVVGTSRVLRCEACTLLDPGPPTMPPTPAASGSDVGRPVAS